MRSFYRNIDGALYVGDNNRAYHMHYGLPQERLLPGLLPIDRGRLLGSVPDRAAARRRVRDQHGIPQDAFVALFCGKYTPRKRALDLASACVDATRRGRPVWAMLLGEGPERATLEKFACEHAFGNVILTGFVNQSEIAAYYAASDVLAVPSDSDPHPLVVTEGASFGLPIVASDAIGCIGPNDTVRAGTNAIVYPSGNRRLLREALERLRESPQLRRRLSAGSIALSEGQGLDAAARTLADATQAMHCLGPRSSSG